MQGTSSCVRTVDGPWSVPARTRVTQTDAGTAADSPVTKFKDETRGLTNRNKQKHYFLIRSPEFCYLGSIVAEDGGTSKGVNVGIQKARGSFSKLRSVWLSKSSQKGTKISIY